MAPIKKTKPAKGKTKAKAKKQTWWKKWGLRLLWLFLIFHAGIVSGGFVFALLYKYIDPPFSTLMIYRRIFNWQEIHSSPSIPLKQLPRAAASMLVKAEDGKFYEHYGIDLDAMESAYKRNEKAGYSKYGGSTLTQQLVKTLLLFPNKLLIRKYVEVIVALEFDLLIDKKRLLELYLNNVEWGPGIFGIEAAAIYHFNKHASELTRDEVARLITILPNPLKYNVRNFSKNRRMSYRYNRLNRILPAAK